MCVDDVVTERAQIGLFHRRNSPPPLRIAITLPGPVEQIVVLRPMIDRLTEVVRSLAGEVGTLREDLAVLRPETADDPAGTPGRRCHW